MPTFGDRHLRSILAEYEAHHNGRDDSIARPFPRAINRRPVLGGLLNEYEWAAQKPWSKTMAEFWHPPAP